MKTDNLETADSIKMEAAHLHVLSLYRWYTNLYKKRTAPV